MTWSTPPTWVTGQSIPASNLNVIRDDLLETAPAKATAAGRHMATTGAFGIAERVCQHQNIPTLESYGSTAFGDCTTVGPSVTVTVSSRCWISMICGFANNTANAASCMSYEIGGATSLAASDARSISNRDDSVTRIGGTILHDVLSAGSTSWVAKYRATAGTSTFQDRRLAAFPL